MRKVGILGMGRWGQTWQRVLAPEPGVQVVAVAARSRRAEISSRSPRLRVYDDYRSLLRDQDLDAVIVTLPPGEHLEAVRLAVGRDLPVLCEKPLVPTRSELQEMVALDESAGVAVRVNQNYRMRGWACAVFDHLPAIGRLRRVTIQFAQPELTDGARAVLAHPLLADMSIHHLDLLRFLTGQEARVLSAEAGRPDDARVWGMTDVDARLALAEGAEVSYGATWAARGRPTSWDGDWTFEGDDGVIQVRDLGVRVEADRHPLRIVPPSPVVDDEDLLVAWRSFVRVMEGEESRRPATVADNARSLELVFDIADAAGVADPNARLAAPRGADPHAATASPVVAQTSDGVSSNSSN
ncbi:Gfo/Idh/MocA family protein [Microbacterium sp. ZXX196]|uniref:Gfo/Idh/MocA family protein n=1 Tax=Microbacterium sp. ZXX196 TaxID=2609291 RepID=UPI0012B80540|nr:Gfo/Idh/MocA family oxidoreductase [Microbacterium sp. ZXX196]MTE24586.1 hypothetical protein [Microbacterium sp. ZXX196]